MSSATDADSAEERYYASRPRYRISDEVDATYSRMSVCCVCGCLAAVNSKGMCAVCCVSSKPPFARATTGEQR